MTSLVDKLKKFGSITLMSAALAAAASAIGGCGTSVTSNSQGTWLKKYNVFAQNDDILLCPAPKEFKRTSNADPYNRELEAEELNLYNHEIDFFVKCTQHLRKTREPLPRPSYLTQIEANIEEIRKAQIEWKQHEATAEESRAHKSEMDRDKIIALQNSGEKVSVHNEHIINNTATGGGEGELVGKINSMFELQVRNSGITIEEQEQICNGTYTGSAQVISIGTIEFEDCICKPKNKTSRGREALITNTTANLEQGDTILYCGNSTEPPAKRCKDLPKDYGNGELSWDRAERTAMYVSSRLLENLNGIAMAAYANKTNKNKRMTEVYLVRK